MVVDVDHARPGTASRLAASGDLGARRADGIAAKSHASVHRRSSHTQSGGEHRRVARSSLRSIESAARCARQSLRPWWSTATTDETPHAVRAAARDSALAPRLLHCGRFDRAGGLVARWSPGSATTRAPGAGVMDADFQYPIRGRLGPPSTGQVNRHRMRSRDAGSSSRV